MRNTWTVSLPRIMPDPLTLMNGPHTEKLKNAKPDLSVLKEYKRRAEEYMNRANDLEKITNERDAQKQKYDGLRKQRLDEFMAGFNLISLKLKEMYQASRSSVCL